MYEIGVIQSKEYNALASLIGINITIHNSVQVNVKEVNSNEWISTNKIEDYLSGNFQE
ncbi:MAG: hypothetical protein HRT72_04360 [Flavobacteriales bacterium]|nr:hypothetical protein [Flavobacteriales bacterium]